MKTPWRRSRVRANSKNARRRFPVRVSEQETYPLMFPPTALIQAPLDAELARSTHKNQRWKTVFNNPDSGRAAAEPLFQTFYYH
jgi:hypothetical protein